MRRSTGKYHVHSRSGYTLLELIVVIGLIAGVTALSVGDSSMSGKVRAMQSAQSAVSGLITLARTKAVSSGKTSRVLLNIEPASGNEPHRFLRYLLVQNQISGSWQTIADLYLPVGVYVVPGDFATLPAGLFLEGASSWTRLDGTELRSTALRSSQTTVEQIDSDAAERWVNLSFGGVGTTTQAGDLVLALGKIRPVTTYMPGDSPITLSNPGNVCGLTLSSYGLGVLIADRSGF